MESDSDSQFSVVLDDGGGISGTEVVDEGTEIVIDEDLTTRVSRKTLFFKFCFALLTSGANR